MLFIGNGPVNAPACSYPRLHRRPDANAHNGIVEVRLDSLSLENVECLKRTTRTEFCRDVKSSSSVDAILNASASAFVNSSKVTLLGCFLWEKESLVDGRGMHEGFTLHYIYLCSCFFYKEYRFVHVCAEASPAFI